MQQMFENYAARDCGNHSDIHFYCNLNFCYGFISQLPTKVNACYSFPLLALPYETHKNRWYKDSKQEILENFAGL